MHRCFFETDISKGCMVTVDGDEALHITRVLRLGVGDLIEITSGNGKVYEAQINATDKKSIDVCVLRELLVDGEPKTDVSLFIGLTKSAKMELIIQKAVELGVSSVVPVEMERSVVKVKDEDKKTQRFRRIAMEAAKQCKRSKIPFVSEPVKFTDAMNMLSNLDFSFVPYECEKQKSIREIFTGKNVFAKSVGFIIGPEGGFSDPEAEFIKENNIQTVTLGKRILRMETAAISVLSIVMYELGEMSN